MLPPPPPSDPALARQPAPAVEAADEADELTIEIDVDEPEPAEPPLPLAEVTRPEPVVLRARGAGPAPDAGRTPALGSMGVARGPAGSQSVADALARSGIRAILNYTSAILHVPDGVRVYDIDPVAGLQSLTYYL